MASVEPGGPNKVMSVIDGAFGHGESIDWVAAHLGGYLCGSGGVGQVGQQEAFGTDVRCDAGSTSRPQTDWPILQMPLNPWTSRG